MCRNFIVGDGWVGVGVSGVGCFVGGPGGVYYFADTVLVRMMTEGF